MQWIGPRWYKVFRDLFENLGRTLLVVASIAVGVAAVGAVLGIQENLSGSLNQMYEQVNPASASLTTEPFDDELVRVTAKIPGIAAAEGRNTLTVRLKLASGEWQELKLYVIADYNAIRINKISPQSGDWPPPYKALLIERASLSLTGAELGDTILIQTPEGKQREMRIAGLAHDLNEPAGTFVNQASGFITFKTLEWLGYPRSYNEMLVLASGDQPDKAWFQQVAERARAKIEKSGREVYWTTVRDPSQHWFQAYLAPMTAILGVLGLLSLFLGCFLVVNTLTALLAQQVRQVGMMKAIGARTIHLILMYAVLVVSFGILAFLVALPLGVLGARLSIRTLAEIINFDLPTYRLSPPVLILEIALSLLIPLLAGLFPILAGTRITVREALAFTGLGQVYFGSGWVDRLVSRIQGLPRPLLLSLRNTFRKKTRLALTLVTLTLGSAIFIAVLTVQSSMLRTLDETLDYYNFDIQVYFDRPYRMEHIKAETLNVEGVSAVETWGLTNTHLVRPDGSQSENIFLAAPPQDSQTIRPRLIQGRWLLSEDENAVVINTDVIKENPGVGLGSTILLDVEGQETSWKVVGVAQSVLIGPWVYTNYPYYAFRLNKTGLSRAAYIITGAHDPQSLHDLARQLEQHYEQTGLRVRSTTLVYDLRQTAVLQFNVVMIFLVIMALIIAVVGCLGLMGTMSLNVMERTREIGVMRSIGSPKNSVLQIFISEGALIGLLSWLAGALLAWPLGRILSNLVGINFIQAPLAASYSVGGAVLWLVIVLVLSSVASLLPALNATRLTVRDVLAYE